MNSPSNDEFLAAVFSKPPEGAHTWVAGFPGSPSGARDIDWRGKALRPGQPCSLSADHNNYFNVSTVKAVGPQIGRKAENFAALHVVVLDDLGTKAGLPAGVDPSYMIETSPGNHQAGFILAEPLTDIDMASAIIKALVAKGLTDPGANGPTSRYMRLPQGKNWKPACGPSGWDHRVVIWAPDRRFSVDGMVSVLGLDLNTAKPRARTTTAIKAVVPTPAPAVSDASVIARLLRSAKAQRIWDRDDAGFSSGSDADEWLLIMLAYQGLSPDQIERIYGQSPRADRKSSDGVCKWRDRSDYRSRSIERALAYVDAHPNGNADEASAMVEAALAVARAQGDPRGLTSPEVVEAFNVLKVAQPGGFDHLRDQAKKAGVKLATLDGEIQRLSGAGNLLHGDAAELAIERLGGKDAVVFTQASWWLWKGHVWTRIDSDERIKQAIHEVLPAKQLTAANVASVLALLRTKVAADLSMGGDHSEVVVPCLNGELVWSCGTDGETDSNGGWTLRPHCREHLRTSVLSTPWAPDAECPTFIRFLWDLVARDEESDATSKIRAIVEAIGYSLTTYTGLDRFVILHGPSASNGKSTLLNLIATLVGKENTCSLSVSQLGERFALARLQGALVNLCPEIGRGETLPEKTIKAITSGDQLTVERKGRDLYDIRPSTTLWFATNTLPGVRDLSPALLDKRCLLIELTRSFEGDTSRDAGLGAKLAAEAPGIMAYCLRAFGRSLALSRMVTSYGITAGGDDLLPHDFCDVRPMEDPPSSVKAKAAWRTDADPLRQFAEERLLVSEGMFTASKDLFSAWQTWAEENGVKLDLTARGLPKRLAMIAPAIRPGEKRAGVRGVVGLALVEGM
jgi:P4 family phage/plasmid primase-like protien